MINDLEKQISQLEAQYKELKAFSDVEMSEPIEQVENPNEPNEDTPQDNFADFVGYLKSSFDQAVVWHHQTNVYSMHKTLNSFYDGILDLTDGLVESVSGIYGRPVDYAIMQPVNYQNPEQVMAYFQACYAEIQDDRTTIYQETWIQNQVDEIATLFAETIYLLTLK
jgi:Family of unknown function (DUF5856)